MFFLNTSREEHHFPWPLLAPEPARPELRKAGETGYLPLSVGWFQPTFHFCSDWLCPFLMSGRPGRL